MIDNRGRLWRLCRKELRETLRDRRTLLTLVMMPLLLYPLLGMTLQRFLLSAKLSEARSLLIGVESEPEGVVLQRLLTDPASLPPEEIREASGSNLATFEVMALFDITAEQALEQRQIDIAVRLDQSSQPPKLEVISLVDNATGLDARRILIERMQWWKLKDAQKRLESAEQQPYQPPVEIVVRTIGNEDKQSLLATVIPLVLILMTITGAVYPAIDLTAGERERGTIEALIASPIARSQILIAKYVAVVVVALLTALVNLIAMLATVWASGLLALLSPDGHLPAWELLQILGLLILFSAFFSAVLLSLTSFARSFKEAQAYLIPLMLLSLTPGVFALMPGVELTEALAIVPLMNIVLLARDLLAGNVAAVPAVAAIVSTLCYAAAALGIAARLFGSDAVLRGSELSVGTMFSRPEKPRAVPSIHAAAFTLAMIFPAYYLVSNAVARMAPDAMEAKLIASACALAAVFGGIPMLAAIIGKDRFGTTFRLVDQRPFTTQLIGLIGGILMGVGLWAFSHELFLVMEWLGIGGLSDDKLQAAKAAAEKLKSVPLVLLLVAFAVTPAVIEELCFRGYLYSSVRQHSSPWKTILVTAVVFGLFHVLTGSVLLIERFAPTTMMGIFIGWVSSRTGSVYTGMLIHFIYNGFINLVMRFQDQLKFLNFEGGDKAHLPPSWIAVACVLVTVGTVLVYISGRRRSLITAVET